MLAGISESLAVLVTLKVAPSFIVRFVCPGNAGATFTSLTIIVKVFVALNGGEPLSVTDTVRVFVLGPCASVGVQVKTPLAELIAALVGAETRLKASVCVGASASVATLVSVITVNSLFVWLSIGTNCGARLTAMTVSRKLLLFVAPAASVTVNVIRLVPD